MTHTRTTNVLPGFGLATGFTMSYLGLLVVIPLAAVAAMAARPGLDGFWSSITESRTLASMRLSLLAALVAAIVNTVFGLLVAWVLARYRFPGRRLVDAMVDLPLALPTAVAGIALTAVYAEDRLLGATLARMGMPVAYTNLGVIVAMMLVSLPFAVRTVQPVLEDADAEIEEAAASLGASPGVTFIRVILPGLVPALLTGFSLTFAKSVGEYGSIIFIASNFPGRGEIAPLLIMTRLEEFDYPAAAAVACAMLAISLVILVTVNALQAWTRRHTA